jgi:MFS transporter, MHS family, proline/betaine transporter
MKKRKIVGPAIVGNIVEYYDYGLYAVYAPIIGAAFFPSGNEFITTLYAFAVFALGFLMRPLGGIVFGYIGDRFGRKTSLTISILGMALATFIIGVIPKYEVIGIAAPLVLIIVRLFQGLCVGGEGAASAIFVLEHTEGYRPGFIGSIVMASNMVGTLLAVFVGIMLDHFCTSEACWRYAFIFGGFSGLIGLYLRFQLTETPAFIANTKEKKDRINPLIHALRTHLPAMIIVMFLGGLTTAVAYTIRGYYNVFFQQVMHYSEMEALYLTSFSLFVMIVFLPLFGLLADKTGYRRFMYWICSVIIIMILPIYNMVATPLSENTGIVFLGLALMGIIAAGVCAPAYAYAIKSFEVELRFSGVAFSWNLGNAVMGGTTPMISRYLSETYGATSPAYYIILLAIVYVIVTILTKNHVRPNK